MIPAASSRVSPGGDIITAILAAPHGRRRTGTSRSGVPATAWWRTLSDAELSFLLALVAADATTAVPMLDSIVSDPANSGSDIQVQVDGDGLTGLARAVPAPSGQSVSSLISRQMITHLSTPGRVVSPPPATVVPLNEPVFVSFDPAIWNTPTVATIAAAGITATVRARRLRTEVFTGDPAQGVSRIRCEGPGRGFDPSDAASPRPPGPTGRRLHVQLLDGDLGGWGDGTGGTGA